MLEKNANDTESVEPNEEIVDGDVLDDELEEDSEVVYEQSKYSVIEPLEDASKLGTYLGVFRPTLLTIFGVIMYVRMGWIVGNAGLLGGLMILFLTFLITGSAALSFSSITTNIRLRAGGVFALVSQSLGLEAGGAIGLPLFLAQSLGAALYIYGFAEGWKYLFPSHDIRLIIFSVFVCGFLLSLISEKLVLRLQVIVLIGVVAALVSMFAGVAGSITESGWQERVLEEPRLWGDFAGGSMWVLFAIFFPSGTGIKVGASLSGKLKDPKKSIPIGVLSAWGMALVVYFALMIWYSVVATPAELQSDYMIAVKKSAWGPAVLIGLLCSCASAALSSMVAAPNVLAALGLNGVLPGGKFLANESKGGTPRNAVMVNGAIVGLALLLGDLNRVAQLITMFFLITYATINIVVLIEQSLGLLSFRPTFKVPIWVPVVGATSSIFAMVITNPFFGLVSLCMVVAIYIYMERRKLETPWETVRSGIFVALADFAARQAQKIEGANERAWKPDLMVPVDSTEQLQGSYRLLLSMMKPKGSLHIMYCDRSTEDAISARLEEITRDFQRESLFATSAVVKSENITQLVAMGTSVLQGSFFRPNVLFIEAAGRTNQEISELIQMAKVSKMGVALLVMHPEARLSRERDINIWIRDQSPDWTLGLRLANIDLAVLLGYQLNRNWQGRLRLLTAVKDGHQVELARTYLKRLFKDARLPGRASIWVEHGRFGKLLQEGPQADLNIFGLSDEVNLKSLQEMARKTHASCLFVMDSGYESALA